MAHQPTLQDLDHEFVKRVIAEAKTARLKFPGPNPCLAALVEEVGELAQAMLHIREGKHSNWSRVIAEAVQVAVMAMRCATEGDATLGLEITPTALDAEGGEA